jgi:hypothetical protein
LELFAHKLLDGHLACTLHPKVELDVQGMSRVAANYNALAGFSVAPEQSHQLLCGLLLHDTTPHSTASQSWLLQYVRLSQTQQAALAFGSTDSVVVGSAALHKEVLGLADWSL